MMFSLSEARLSEATVDVDPQRVVGIHPREDSAELAGAAGCLSGELDGDRLAEAVTARSKRRKSRR